jgi:O-antigen ligase
LSALKTYLNFREDRILLMVAMALLTIFISIILFAPSLIIPATLLPIVLIGGVSLMLKSRALIIGSILSSIFVVHNAPGLDPGEILYYVLWALVIGIVIVPTIYRAEIGSHTVLDKQYILICLFMLLAVATGILFSGRGIKVVEEVVYFYSGLVFYYAIRNNLDSKEFRVALVSAISFIFFYVVFLTYWSYRTALVSAVEEWELNFARGAGNENYLLVGTISVLVILVYTKKVMHQVGLVMLFVLSVGAVVITLTRSLWVVTILSLGMVFLFLEAKEKKRYIQYFSAALIIITILAFVYLDFSVFVLELLAFRFQSFGDGAQDLSLLERIYETQSVWERIMQNPISGWGFGTQFTKYDVILGRTSTDTSYIHNGYLAIWFKLGLFGLIAILSYCATLYVYAFIIYKRAKDRNFRMIGLVIICYLPSAALMNITSPVLYTYEGSFLLIMFGSVVSWFTFKHSKNSISTEKEA